MVALTVTDINGCSNTRYDPVCVVPPLGAAFTATRVCHGQYTFFDGEYLPAGDSIVMWRWDMDDGNIITTTADTLSYLYGQPGTYYASLTVENAAGCQVVITRQVIVDELPQVAFTASQALCDEPTQFTDMSDPGYGAAIQQWAWDFGDPASGALNTSDEQNPLHLYPAADSSYVVTLVVTNTNGCVDSLSQVVSKGLCMQARFEVSGQSQCHNTQVCFADSSFILGDGHAIQSWMWDFGDGAQLQYGSFQDPVCHSYSQWGTYTVTLIVQASAGGTLYSDTAWRQVTVSAVPSAAFALQSPCANAMTLFSDISASHGVDITQWAWDFGDPTTVDDTSSLASPAYHYTQPGTYPVQLVVTNLNGCSDTISTQVSIFESPQAAFSASLACQGGPTRFTDESTPAEAALSTWRWAFGDGATASLQQPAHVYADTGSFFVQLVVADTNQCADTASTMVTVMPVPLSAFQLIDRYQNIQGQILLDNQSQDAVSYLWDLGNGEQTDTISPVVRYEQDGTYLIRLIAYAGNECPDTAFMEYVIVFQGLYVPTGFTPDGKNPALREFKPVGVNLEYYKVTVINEKGNVVFSSDRLDFNGSPAEGWDGTANGVPLPTGTYLWTISAKFRDGSIWTGTDAGDGNTKTYGRVLLIR